MGWGETTLGWGETTLGWGETTLGWGETSWDETGLGRNDLFLHKAVPKIDFNMSRAPQCFKTLRRLCFHSTRPPDKPEKLETSVVMDSTSFLHRPAVKVLLLLSGHCFKEGYQLSTL